MVTPGNTLDIGVTMSKLMSFLSTANDNNNNDDDDNDLSILLVLIIIMKMIIRMI